MDYRRMPQHKLEVHTRKLAIAWHDLLMARTTFQWLIEHPSYSQPLSGEREALINAAVVAYSRPFVASRGSAHLAAATWPGYTCREWQRQHDELIDYRNAFVGHSSLKPREVTIMSTKKPPGWSAKLNLPMFLPGIAERGVAMCSDIIERLHDHLGEAANELIRRERDQRTPDAPVRVVLRQPR